MFKWRKTTTDYDVCECVELCMYISVSKYEFTLKLIAISNLNEHFKYITDKKFDITLRNIYL